MSGWLITVELQGRGGAARVEEVQTIRHGEDDVVHIGRGQGCQICIPRDNVSRRHCMLVVRDGKILIADGGSSNGTWVNGERVSRPQPFGPEDRLFVGDHVVRVLGAPVPCAPPSSLV